MGFNKYVMQCTHIIASHKVDILPKNVSSTSSIQLSLTSLKLLSTTDFYCLCSFAFPECHIFRVAPHMGPSISSLTSVSPLLTNSFGSFPGISNIHFQLI